MTEAPVKRRSHTIVPKIEEVENGRLTFRAVHGDVHELDGFVARVVDCVKLSRTQLGDKGAAVLKLGSLGESSKSLTTKENRREETVSHS